MFNAKICGQVVITRTVHFGFKLFGILNCNL